MKQIPLIQFLALFTFPIFTSSASVPLRWTVETSRVQPVKFDAIHGETLDLEAVLLSNGKPMQLSDQGVPAIYWQTNGMGNVYWIGTAAAVSNRLCASFTPAMDVGAKSYNCFIGVAGSIYRAAFQLSMRQGPGASPNHLPLPTPTIDFSRVIVTNVPWATPEDIPDGSARPLPKYLHALDFDYGYPEDAKKYYRIRGAEESDGGCSAVRSGNFIYRNFDFPFDDRAEFIVRMSAGPGRLASVGVAQVGTNLTERMVTSGKPEYSARYKWLPGATVDGINEHGVVAEINVVDGDPQKSGWHNTGDIHPLAAVRWVLDNATNAQHAATFLAENIRFPQGWTQNFHYMVADGSETYVVEDGWSSFVYHLSDPVVLTNLRTYGGEGTERWDLLMSRANITNAWYTRAYRRETNPPWVSDLAGVLAYSNEIFDAWASHPKEYFRGRTVNGEPWWQTVHTSVYDITNRVLRVAVQETDDWYVFQVPSSCGGSSIDTNAVIDIAQSVVAPAVNAAVNTGRAITAAAAAAGTNYTDDVVGQLSSTVSSQLSQLSASLDSKADFADVASTIDTAIQTSKVERIYSPDGHQYQTSAGESYVLQVNHDYFECEFTVYHRTYMFAWDEGYRLITETEQPHRIHRS